MQTGAVTLIKAQHLLHSLSMAASHTTAARITTPSGQWHLQLAQSRLSQRVGTICTTQEANGASTTKAHRALVTATTNSEVLKVTLSK